MPSRLLADRDRLHTGLMLALTFSTGVVDSLGYLGLDRVFTGNMTGNVVILGMALTGAENLPIAGPIIALALFMLGALIAGRVLRNRPVGWSARTTGLLFVVAGVLLVAAVPEIAVQAPRPEWLTYGVTGALGFAMGTQAGAARQVAVKDVTTVVVTSTLVGLAFDSHFGGRGRQPWFRRLAAVVLIGLGALSGAALLRVHLGWGIALSFVITISVAILGHVGRPAPAPAPTPAPAPRA
ncbi:YoaK family protein [Galbitalea sp. SE-J8]|uniref:YoaK family protein n=1 Tax=Galbitalea sp. SE-J8 TaxID=3054952 RepID=UPI00259CF799|nr:YoaK family protein [Galbitalea sp. SE-J8]MDM4762864.1 YoaK family protein [Galbitalea sp. SE-J8]